jgi:protein TonB
VVSYTKPAYPPRLRNLGVEGSVVLEITVAADGTPQSVTVVRSSGYPEMDSRAAEALRRARYSPQTVGDAPVAGVLSLLVRYTLE